MKIEDFVKSLDLNVLTVITIKIIGLKELKVLKMNLEEARGVQSVLICGSRGLLFMQKKTISLFMQQHLVYPDGKT